MQASSDSLHDRFGGFEAPGDGRTGRRLRGADQRRADVALDASTDDDDKGRRRDRAERKMRSTGSDSAGFGRQKGAGLHGVSLSRRKMVAVLFQVVSDDDGL